MLRNSSGSPVATDSRKPPEVAKGRSVLALLCCTHQALTQILSRSTPKIGLECCGDNTEHSHACVRPGL